MYCGEGGSWAIPTHVFVNTASLVLLLLSLAFESVSIAKMFCFFLRFGWRLEGLDPLSGFCVWTIHPFCPGGPNAIGNPGGEGEFLPKGMPLLVIAGRKVPFTMERFHLTSCHVSRKKQTLTECSVCPSDQVSMLLSSVFVCGS